MRVDGRGRPLCLPLFGYRDVRVSADLSPLGQGNHRGIAPTISHIHRSPLWNAICPGSAEMSPPGQGNHMGIAPTALRIISP